MIVPASTVALAGLMLALGLASAGLAAVVRKMPWWPKRWLNVAPLNCATCLNLWSSLAVTLAFTTAQGSWHFTLTGAFAFLLVWGGAMGISMYVTVMSGVFVDRDSLALLGSLPDAPLPTKPTQPPETTPPDSLSPP